MTLFNPAITLLELVHQLWRRFIWRYRFQRLNGRMDDLARTIGQKTIPALGRATEAMDGLVAVWMEDYEND